MTTYSVCAIRSNKDGFTALAKLKKAIDESTDTVFELDFSTSGWFDAHMAAPLQAVLLSATDKKISVVKMSASVEKILRKNLFLCQYGYEQLHDNNQTTLPFRCFQFSDRQIFDAYLNEHLSGKGMPKMSEKLSKKFRQSIFEIFENCGIHSKSQQGVFVCGQYFPRERHLDLTIADAGVGIRTNVREKYNNPKISSVEAIRWAIKKGNTTKTGSQPGGFGLALLQEFIEHNQGKIQIVSRQGYYEFSKVKKKFEKLDGDFLGTTINLRINTNDNNNYCLRSEISSDNIF